MSKVARLVVLVAAVASLCGAVSASAEAVTWHNSGATAFTASSGANTLTFTHADGTNSPLPCAGGGTTTGDAPVGSFSAGYTITGTFTLTPCVLFMGRFFVHCNFQMTAAAYTAGSPAVTSGPVDLTCTVKDDKVANVTYCHLEGALPAHYVNPVGATPGRLTFTAGSTVRGTHTSGASCFWLINETSAPVDWFDETMTLSSATGPVLTRTP